MAEASTGAGWRSGGAEEGGGDGRWDAWTVVFDYELKAAGDDAEGDADGALRLGGLPRRGLRGGHGWLLRRCERG